MIKRFVTQPEIKLIAKVIIALFFLFLLFLLAIYNYVKYESYAHITRTLQKNLEQVASDIRTNDGELDARMYYQDSTTPLDNPLYIVTTNGFVIERMNPIDNILNTANINFAQSFTEPQTITTEVNTIWRIYSYPILRNGTTEGVILTAYYDPGVQALEEIDENLVLEAKKIDSLVEHGPHGLAAAKLTSRLISHSIYYSVIDKYNRVVAEDGGPPTYIDRSFVAQFLKSPQPHEIINEQTDETYFISSYPLQNNKHEVLGVIVTGQSIKSLQDILRQLKSFSLVSGAITLFIITGLLIAIFGRELKKIVTQKAEEILRESQKKTYMVPQKILFHLTESFLLFDETKIPIEYGSKQYDLCKTLFSAPSKRWEYDQLLDKNHLTEEDQNERTFYDASLRINSKLFDLLGLKFIVYEDKTYRINSTFTSKVIK